MYVPDLCECVCVSVKALVAQMLGIEASCDTPPLVYKCWKPLRLTMRGRGRDSIGAAHLAAIAYSISTRIL